MSGSTGVTGPTDAELVAGVLAADRESFATVYDRYGTKLYDFAYSMLRHREDAADAVADSFVLVAERLHQLRDPDRLRPWLYAIVRSECLRRLRARKRIAFGHDEQLVAMADDALTPDQEAEQAAMRQIVWDAAVGLADRDRALLDLHLRQGLEGAELGEAMGVSAANAYVMLNRLRAQVDRSLGALLIARLGRDDCDDLAVLLSDWDGTFSPLVRKRIARHVDDCAICAKRRMKMLSPWMLLATVPLFAAPPSLRNRVVGQTEMVAWTTPNGAPLTPAPRRRHRGVAAAAAALVVAVGGAAALLWPSGNDATPSADIVVSTTTAAPQVSKPAVTKSLQPSPTVKPTTAKPTKVSAQPGLLTSSTSAISLGRGSSSSTVTLTNSGGSSLGYRLRPGAGWLSVSPTAGRLDAGAATQFVIRADRTKVREGVSTGTVAVGWDSGSSTIKVSLEEQRAPSVGRPTTGANPSCSVPVRVTVSDESGLRSVVLSWSGPSGSGNSTMLRSGSRWVGEMGPFSVGGTVKVQVKATDKRGNSSTGPTARVSVDPCPQ